MREKKNTPLSPDLIDVSPASPVFVDSPGDLGYPVQLIWPVRSKDTRFKLWDDFISGKN